MYTTESQSDYKQLKLNEKKTLILIPLDACFNSDRWKLHFVQSGCVDQLLEIEDSRLMRKVMDIIILVVSEGKANSLYK